MDKLNLKAQKRTMMGRKVKALRQKGILPGNIYGNKVKSTAIELPIADFRSVYKKAGETKIIELILGESDIRPVLIHNVQMDSLTGFPVHADFYQVNLKQKVKTQVPVEPTGVAPAVDQKLGLLLQTLNEVEIEALPADLPEKLTIDIKGLTVVDQELKVSDIKIPSGVTLLTDVNLTVLKIGQLVSKEAEELAKEEEAAAAAAKAATAEKTEGKADAVSSTPEEAAAAAEAKNTSEAEASTKKG